MPPSGAGAKPSRLQRRLSLERAWKQYLGGVDPRGVRDEIASSWLRTRDTHRVDPLLPRVIVSLASDALAERRARDEAYRLAGPVLDAFTRRAKLRDHVLAYFDGTGALLSLEGDPAVAAELAAIGYCPGAVWSEAVAGTNAAGIALATGRSIEVFAAEHYVAAWQRWSSAAVPVRTPGATEPVGIVAMTGPWEVRRRQALTFVLAVGRAVEERLRAAAGIREEVVRYAFRAARETGDAIAAVDAQGRVTSVNEAAALSPALEDGALAASAREAVVKALAAPPGRGDAEVTLDAAGASATVTPVRYEGARIGAILRIRPAPGALGTGDRLAARYDFRNVLGSSPRIRRAADLAATAARNDLPVVLCGESGTGKELFAHAIHAASARRGRRFLAVNCGSIPAELLEAELFGYEPGTFTGGRGEGNAGRFEEADGGTLLLDEVSELAPAAQTALLRVLQEREIVRLGGSKPRTVDVRVLAATNRPLEDELREGRFRPDLYYRLNVLVIAVPPLRDRGDDVLELARAFLAEADVSRRGLTLAPDALEAIRAYRWPGNVRELKNVILRAAAVATRPEITARCLVLGPGGAAIPPRREREDTASAAEPALERGELVGALDACGWNFRRTAHQLGISRMTLYRWLRKHGISRSPPQSE